MKFPRIPSALALLALTFTSLPADAAYYTVREVETKCSNQARNAAEGAGAGAAIGCGLGVGLGLIFNQGRDIGRACAGGAIVGGTTGAVIGLAASCQDEVRYMTYWDRSLDRRHVSHDYESWGDGCRGRIVREGRDRRHGYMCREFETYISTPQGSKYHHEISCREGDHWRHGYESSEIEYASLPPRRDDRRRDDRRRYDERDDRYDDRDGRDSGDERMSGPAF